MRQDSVTGNMLILWTNGHNRKNYDIYFARYGVEKLQIWLIATITTSSKVMICAATVIAVFSIRQKRHI
ncbi:MAG: hypothetical protein JW776_13860 [Candidatus Lokiarchaeota archaeon]|nr:hypothetical protein [Candidatus Lokiarchaeota archaeon]